MQLKKGSTVYEDTQDKIHFKESDGKEAVECCGKAIRMVAHFDGKDVYGYTYNCECGNIISVTYKRSKEDREWW